MEDLEKRVESLEISQREFERSISERVVRLEVAIEELKGLRSWTEDKLDDMRDEIADQLRRISDEQHKTTQNRLMFAGMVVSIVLFGLNALVQYLIR